MLNVTRSGYYAWRGRSASRRQQEDQKLLVRIRHIHDKSHGIYGSPRITATLHRQGVPVSKKRVARLMQENQLVGRIHSKKGWMPVVNQAIKKQVNRRLSTPAPRRPNQIWVGDVTYIWHQKRWWYLAVVMDLCSRKVVGWSLQQYRTAVLTQQALQHALKKRKPENAMIFHTDRGVEYGASQIQTLLENYGIKSSMNRPGHCTDNAHMESFFHSLKGEWLKGVKFNSASELRKSIQHYIVYFYNRVRLHSGINYYSPDEYERLLTQ